MPELKEQLNSVRSNAVRVEVGVIRWPRLVAIAPARTLFLLCAQALFASVYYLRGDAQPWRSSTAWWTVYGTLADLGCLAVLRFALQVEGLRIRDLFLASPVQSLSKTLRQGALYLLIVMPLFLGGFVLSSFLVYGSFRPGVDGALLGARQLPLWAAVYSVTGWFVIWSMTEELTYQGYLLQRFESISGGTVPGLLIVGFWWSVQHGALPFLPDARYVLWRFLGFVPGVTMLMVLFMRNRQLAPVILAHSVMDLIASSTTIAWHS